MPRVDMDYSSVNRSTAEARSFYNRISPYYDTLAASEKKYIRAGLRLLDPNPGDRILEIGSGTGFALVEIARELKDKGHAYGIDISPGMIHRAQNKLREQRVEKIVSLILDDAHVLPFESQSMNAVFMSFTLELFHRQQIPRVLKECHRVVKPDGRMCVVSLSKGETKTFMSQVYEWLHDRFPRILDCRPIPVEALLKAHGFQIQEAIHTAMWGLPISINLVSKLDQQT